MASDTLTIAIETPHRVTLRAAWELARAWREGGGAVRLARGGRRGPPSSPASERGPRVCLGVGSLVRPSAVVHFEHDFAPEAAALADQLALTIAAWDALDDADPWRALSAPLPTATLYGRPSRERPWALSLAPRAFAGDHQLHLVGLPLPGRADVFWPRLAPVVAAVLGRAECVLGDRDPLAYDALRAGVVLHDGSQEVTHPVLDGALAGLVPPTLTTDRALWRQVAETARDLHRQGNAAPTPLMTPAWVARGRDRMREHLAAPPSPWERMRRRHDKLRRDPQRFFADSRHRPLRALGELLFR